jgi:hypothetical protein
MKDDTGPGPNVLLIAVAMSLGIWGLLYLGVASIWSRLANQSHIAVEGEVVPQIANLTDQPKMNFPARTKVKNTRKRWLGPALAARVFHRSSL